MEFSQSETEVMQIPLHGSQDEQLHLAGAKADCMISLPLFGYVKLWAALCYLVTEIPTKKGQLGLMGLMSLTTDGV